MDRFRGEAQTKQNLTAPRPLGNQFVRWSRLANQGLCDGHDLLTLRSAREQGLPTDLEKGTALMNSYNLPGSTPELLTILIDP